MGEREKVERKFNHNISFYYRKAKEPLRCPYCGSTMAFSYHVYYEGCTREWICPTCGLSMPDSYPISEETRAAKRKAWREYLRKELETLRGALKRVERAYFSYGKFMSPEERREILGDILEEQAGRAKREAS